MEKFRNDIAVIKIKMISILGNTLFLQKSKYLFLELLYLVFYHFLPNCYHAVSWTMTHLHRYILLFLTFAITECRILQLKDFRTMLDEERKRLWTTYVRKLHKKCLGKIEVFLLVSPHTINICTTVCVVRFLA